MSLSVVFGLIWILVANLAGMVPSRDQHWTRAYALIACGLPLLVWIGWQAGPWIALGFLLAAGSVLRWPVFYLFRWLRRVAGRGVAP